MHAHSVFRIARMTLVASAIVTAMPCPSACGGVVGQWDFANGWNATNGLIPATTAMSGMTLSYLPNTGFYQYPQALGQPDPPQLQFATTGSFGIANLGSGGETVVMRMPDMRGYGIVTGLMARFQQMANGDGTPTRLNRYSVVMDVYIPDTTVNVRPPDYLTLFQTRLAADGAWLIDKRNGATGLASSYGGFVAANAWNRLALVMNLSDSDAVSQYQAYVNGSLAATIVPDLVPQTSDRNHELVERDLFTDQALSIGTLNDSLSGLGTDSAFFLFNADRNDSTEGMAKGELGVLYVANLQFRDDALSSGDVLALGGAAPGIIPVPEPTTLGLLAAAAAAGVAGGGRLTRRRVLSRLGGSVVAGAVAAEESRARDVPAAPTKNLTDLVHAGDAKPEWKKVAVGELGLGRYVAAELRSQTWRGIPWRHQLAVCVPAKLAVERPPLVLWVEGGSTPEAEVTPPAKQLPIAIAVAEASGLPVAVVRQVPNQPLFGNRREDDLIAHSFEQFLATGDPTWPLLVPMVKSVVSSIDAAEDLAKTEWQLELDGCVVTGASKRGWTSWLSAAVEPRIRGLMPMVIDMLDLPRHMRLQVASFGGPSEALADYVSRGLHLKLESPRGDELLDLIDPARHAAAITQPKILAMGANDEYWPLESLDLYRGRLRGPTWVSYAPNAGHDLPPMRVAPLVAALGRHVAGVEPLPELAWSCDADGPICSLSVDPEPAAAVVWTARSGTRDFRKATWEPRSATLADGRLRESIPMPSEGFAAAVVECRFDRRPLPLFLSSGPLVVGGG